MMRLGVGICLLLLFAVGTAAANEARPPADLVVLNGKVWTVDNAHPQAEAIAVVGDRIAAVGTNEEIQKWVGPKTRTIDAQGKTVLPGLIDAHVHFVTGGFDISGVQLKDAATPEEFVRRIGDHAKKISKGEWIVGGTWDHENWPGAPLPSREWIDKTTPDNPVFVSRYDGHMALANSLALKLAGVTRDTPVPSGGEIVKDKNGEPTGLLKDAAMGLVFRVIPDATEEQRTRAVRAALKEAARFGVTSVHDISSAEDVRLYQKLLGRGELTARIYCITPLPQWQAPAQAGLAAKFGTDWIHLGALKGFADGSLGSTTALFFEPFTDAPNTSGLPNEMMFPEGNMLKMALGADAAGLQLAIHAIGDKAIRIILDVYAEVEKQHGRRDAASDSPNAARRWRIEHAQHVHPDDFAKFAKLGVIASMQPYHAIDDGRWAEKRIGHERCKTTYAFRTFLDQGVKLAFGSDWTVAPLNPMTGIYAAVTRATLDGKNPGGWFPEQRITLAEAIEAYTMGSAYAEFGNKEKGSITAGKLADIVVLDSDLFALAPEKIKDAKVMTTVVGGRIVFEGKK
jgi:predicted amidohydrolase YtcJ